MQLNDKNSKTNLASDITITINKNAENPYAVLRSELEHARDIAKREVPNQSEKHFSRYKGINESEMSLGYVKKKADTRLGKTKTEQKIQEDSARYDYDIEKKNDPSLVTSEGKSEFTSVTIRTKEGKPLGHIRYHDMGNNTLFVDMMENYQGGGGFVRTAIAKVLKENPDKKVYWQAISKESVSSYNKFLDEYLDLANRVEFEDRSGKALIDEVVNSHYNNSKKGVIDETRSNNSKLSGGSRREISQPSQGTSRQYDRQDTGNNTSGISTSNNIAAGQHSSSRLSNDETLTSNSNKSKSSEYFKQGNATEN